MIGLNWFWSKLRLSEVDLNTWINRIRSNRIWNKARRSTLMIVDPYKITATGFGVLWGHHWLAFNSAYTMIGYEFSGSMTVCFMIWITDIFIPDWGSVLYCFFIYKPSTLLVLKSCNKTLISKYLNSTSSIILFWFPYKFSVFDKGKRRSNQTTNQVIPTSSFSNESKQDKDIWPQKTCGTHFLYKQTGQLLSQNMSACLCEINIGQSTKTTDMITSIHAKGLLGYL